MNNALYDGLDAWVGKTETHLDLIAAWPIAAMAATLDYPVIEPKSGDVIPPGWHWLYFLEAKRAAELGSDGHPKRGGFLPPVALPRRMWAGGRIEFKHPLRIGDQAQRRSEILKIEHKTGRSGNLIFVTVGHDICVAGRLAISEQHDIVYRDAAPPGQSTAPGKAAPDGAIWHENRNADSTMLFRYSALTFNGHRIHYDLDYAKHEEHYPGLIVHGPLQTTLMLELCRHKHPSPVTGLEYKALHPLFHTESFTVNGNLNHDGTRAELWTANSVGHYAMTGTAYF